MKKSAEKISINELKELHEPKRQAIRQRLTEFKNIPPSEYFYELVYCLLTPQSSAINAGRAVRLLQEHNFFRENMDPEHLLHQKEFYIRFHRTKAKHLLALKENYDVVFRQLTNGSPSTDLRLWLVTNVKGLGWKEASHFLRNTGHENLAILDRHILKNLRRTGVIRSLPKTLTGKRYLSIEKKFFKFAQQMGVSMDELDLLFWSMETGEILK